MLCPPARPPLLSQVSPVVRVAVEPKLASDLPKLVEGERPLSCRAAAVQSEQSAGRWGAGLH